MHTSFWWVPPPGISFVLQSFKFNHISLWGFIPPLHFSSLNSGKIWWCVFSGTHLPYPQTFLWKEEHWADCFSPSHHTTPADTTEQINIAAVICNTTKPPELLCTFAAFSRSSAVSFSVFCHISCSTGALIFVFSWTKRHICRDEVKRGRCAGLVARCTLTHWALPARITTFCGTFLSWGWLGGQAEVRRPQRDGALQASSLGSQELLIPAVPTKPSTCEGLNPTRVTSRVQTHSFLCCFQLK